MIYNNLINVTFKLCCNFVVLLCINVYGYSPPPLPKVTLFHTSLIMSHQYYYVTPVTLRHTRIIMSHQPYYVTPVVLCHTSLIMSHQSYYVTPVVVCHASLIMSHQSHYVTSFNIFIRQCMSDALRLSEGYFFLFNQHLNNNVPFLK